MPYSPKTSPLPLAARHVKRADLERSMLLHAGPGIAPAGPMVNLAYLADRRRKLETGLGADVNPYQGRFLNFLNFCVWSIDEARGGQVRKWPTGQGKDGRDWNRVWLEMERELLEHKLLFIEKSRRVLASWLVCAWDVWLAAGGQDPRWTDEDGRETLMLAAGNRQIVLAARKMEGLAGSEWFIERRVKALLDNFESRGGREFWPDFPGWSFKSGEIAFANGSYITGVPQGSHQTRGSGITHLHCEEVAFWEEAAGTIGAAVPTLRGGGHITCVTTANVGTYAQQIRDGTLREEH